MNKTTKQTLAALAIATTVTGTATVKAEEIKPAVTPETATEATVEKAVTEADVKAATEAETKAQEAVAEQEATIATLEASKTEQETAITTAEDKVTLANEALAETSPEAITQAESDVTTATETVTATETELEAAKTEADTANNNYHEAGKELSFATGDVRVQTERVTELAQAIDAIETTDTTALENAVTTAQVANQEAIKAEEKAQSAYDEAVKANEDKAQAIEKATEAVTLTKTAADLDANRVTATASETKTAKAELDKAMAEKEKAEKLHDISSRLATVINRDSEYERAFKEKMHRSTDEAVQEEFDNIIADASDATLSLWMELLDLEEDGPTVDPSNLTDEQIADVNKFLLKALNPIREGRGVETFNYHEITNQITNAVANMFQAKADAEPNKNVVSLGHASNENYKSILAEIDPNVKKLAENISGTAYSGNKIALKEYKSRVIDGLYGFLFDDAASNWGHKTSILGARNTDNNILTVANYGNNVSNAFAFTYYTIANNSPLVSELEAVGGSATTTALNTAMANVTKAQDTYNKAKQAETEAKDRAVLSRARHEQAKANLNRLTTDDDILAKASEELATAKAEVVKTAQALVDAKANLKVAEDMKAKQAETLASLKAEKAEAEKVLADYQEILAEKRAAYEQAEIKDLEAKAKVKAIEAKLETAKTTVAKATERVLALKDAPAYLEKAEHELALAKKALATTLEALKEAKTELAVRQTIKAKATAEKERVIALYEKAQAEEKRLNDLRDQLDKAHKDVDTPSGNKATEKSNTATKPSVKPSVAKTPQQTTKVAVTYGNKPTPQTTQTTAYKAPATTRATKQELPKTGDASSALGLAGLALSALGLTVRPRKKHN